MSQFSELMEELVAIREQNAWLVAAVKHLLGNEVGWQPEALLGDMVDELDLDQGIDEDVLAPQPQPKACPHNRQGLGEHGQLICIRCGIPLAQSGVVGRDANAPVPGSQTRGPSSKNPGTPLVPY